MGILTSLILFPPRWLNEEPVIQQAAQNQSETAIQESVLSPRIEPQKISTRPHQNIYVSPENLKYFLRELSTTEGVDYDVIYSVVVNESGFNLNAYNPSGDSYGVAQFLPSTFHSSCRGDYLNPYDQLRCMVTLFSEGKAYLWDAYCNLYYDENCIKKRGLYPGFL